jgi:hypothetical protein
MKLLQRAMNSDPRRLIGTGLGRRAGAASERSREPSPAALRPAPVLRRFDTRSPNERLAPGFTELLDRLRAYATQGIPARALVFAAATPSAASAHVMEGVTARAELLGMQVVRGEMRGVPARSYAPARPALPVERPNHHSLAVAPQPTALDLEVQGWLGQHRDADLVLIEGPPLLQSIDAALVARACDGLILIAERGVTERRALQEAARRARISGCALLGVVLTGASSIPGWVQRLTGTWTRPLTA